MAEVHGHCDPAFLKVQDLLQQNISSEDELGASICVNINGANVVDIWGGYVDVKRSRPWTKDSLVVVWSITKCVTNMAALMLVDRGLLDPFEKVSTYWPEFAANGKDDIEVRHLLSHTSGLAAWDQPVTVEEIYDVPKATERLAKQGPWWTPGTASGYHAISQGHLVGELVRRISGKSLKRFVADEIAGPLGADFSIGAQETDWGRIAELIPPPALLVPRNVDPGSIAAKAAQGTPIKADYAMTREFRNTELGASNGFGNARSVVRALSPISLGGEVDGLRLLSPKTIDHIFKEQSNGVDLVLGNHLRFGIGFGLPHKEGAKSFIPEGRVCYWGGWGGSIVIMDLDRKMTLCYVMNKMELGTTGSSKAEDYVKAVYEAVGK